MGSLLKARVVRMGNSRGIRIPKVVIDQLGLDHEIEMEVRENSLVIRSVKHPREGWAEQFKAMAANGDDRLLDDEPLILTEVEKSDWQW